VRIKTAPWILVVRKHDGIVTFFEGVPEIGMSNLVMVAFPSEQKAEQGRRKLLTMEKENLIAMEDAVIAVKKADGTIKIRQFAESGALWGIRSAASGNPAPTGAGALTDFGANDKFVKDVAEAIPRGGAAILLLVWKMTADQVLEGFKAVGGKVLRTSFDSSGLEAICTSLTMQA
jgi:uncharacterized membrane protein